jgi:hypothetical protein
MVKRKSVKATIKPALLDKGHLKAINDFVVKVQNLTQAAYLFAKYIFVSEATHARTTILSQAISQNFYQECLLALNSQSQLSLNCRSEATLYYRRVVNLYIEDFTACFECAPTSIKNVQQTTIYQARTMYTAYLNNLQYHLEYNLQRVVNEIFKRRNHELQAKSRAQIEATRRKCKNVKEFLLPGTPLNIDLFNEDELETVAILYSIVGAQINDGSLSPQRSMS